MMKTGSGSKKNSRPFKDFYLEWSENLKALLPLLQQSMAASANLLDSEVPVTHHQFGAMVSSSDLLSTQVQMLHHHFQAYFQALDLAARQDVAQLLYPEWRNSLEKPFLWLGDFHPFLFSHLLRSFLSNSTPCNPSSSSSSTAISSCSSNNSNRNSNNSNSGGKPLPFGLAWAYPSSALLERVEQIDRGLRLMIPALVRRLRDAQEGFATCIASDWEASKGREEAWKAIDGAATAQMEELMCIFVDANRLRRSILAEIMGATDVYQAALYLEGLSQFFIGFRDPELVHDLERCKLTLSYT